MKTALLFFASLLCFAAEPQTGIDFSQKLIGPDDKPLVNDGASKPDAPVYLTLGFVSTQALYATLKEDTDAQQNHDMAKLARKILKAGSTPVALTVADRKLIMDRIAKVFPKITQFAAWCVLDPATCE
jgi:hypothetical protein